MKPKQIAHSILLPICYIIKPSNAGKEDTNVSLLSASIYAFLICLSAYITVSLFMSLDTFSEQQEQILSFGALLFPVAICLIGLLLHFAFPAHDQRLRIPRMIALPWVCLSSAAILVLMITLLQSSYIVTTGLSAVEAEALGKSMNTVNAWVVFLMSANIFWNGLTNIRRTSKIRNSGDTLIICALLAIPYFLS